jgi:hypothetical protein
MTRCRACWGEGVEGMMRGRMGGLTCRVWIDLEFWVVFFGICCG